MNKDQLNIFDYTLPDLEDSDLQDLAKECTHTINGMGWALPWEQEEHQNCKSYLKGGE